MPTEPIYTVLPPREHFSKHAAGAIAIVVAGMAQHTRWPVKVLAEACADPLLPAAFIPIQPWFYRWRSRSRAYARCCGRWLHRQPASIVEVHNRVALVQQVQKMAPQHHYCLYLHNDPLSVKGLTTAAQRQALLHQCAQVYVVSEFLKQRFLRDLPESCAAKVQVIYNGCEQPRTDPTGKRKQILFVGRVIPEKGALELAQALVQLLPSYPDWHAVFIGARHFGSQQVSSTYEQQVLATLAKLPTHQWDYRHARPHPEVMAAFASARIAVTPSKGLEAFGRTALEALASGCALISSARGGLAEVIGESALIIDPDKPQEIAAALRRLLDDPVLRQHLAEQGLHQADHFRQQPAVARHDALRQQVSQQQPPAT